MCGIAGVVCVEPRCDADHSPEVESMCDVLRHRGPDDGAVVARPGACLGSRRLSILDLSPAGRMPMSDPTDRWSITYNGEIYNFLSIRSELEGLGHRFRSQTDTEVLLRAWIEWGAGCVDRLVGMFAFAVHDRESGEVALVRDRFGIKPLYYRVGDGHVVFASEAKAIVAVGGARLDHRSLLEWSLYRNVDALTPETIFDEVLSVLPGQCVRIRGGVEAEQLYSPLAAVSEEAFERYGRLPTGAVIDELGAVLEDAVESRLVADVPVGTLLSGGLDSSLVTAIAARHEAGFKAFHVSLQGYGDLDESRYAERVGRDLGIELVRHELTGEDFRRALPRVVYHSDLPLTHPNTVAYDVITRVAREHGVIVLLSGEGADELFGGYRWSYRRRRALMRLTPLLSVLPARLRNIVALVTYWMAGMPATSWRFRELLPETVGLVDRYAREAWYERCVEAYGFVDRVADRHVLASTIADLHDFLAPLLRRLDRTSMANSVECRVPFLDHRLVHLAIQLPLSYRLGARADKWVLKQVAEAYLPTEIIRRKKVGFPLPTAEFIAPLLAPALYEEGFLVRDLGMSWPGLRRRLSERGNQEVGAFGLLTLELWGRLFIRGQSVDQLDERLAGMTAGPAVPGVEVRDGPGRRPVEAALDAAPKVAMTAAGSMVSGAEGSVGAARSLLPPPTRRRAGDAAVGDAPPGGGHRDRPGRGHGDGPGGEHGPGPGEDLAESPGRGKQKDTSRHVVRGTAALSAAHGFLMVAGYVVGVVLARDLGPVLYGVYGLVYSVLLGAELIGRLGIPQAMSRLIAQQSDAERGLAGTGVALSIAIYVPLFAAFWFGAPLLADLFNVPDGTRYFRVAALDIPFFGLYFAGSHIINGRREFVPEAVAVGLYGGAKVVGILILIATAVTIEGALIVNAVASIVALMYLVWRLGPGSFVPRLSHVREVVTLAIWVGLFSLGAQLLASFDLWALNAIGEGFPEQVKGFYVGATNLGRIANVMAFVMTAVLIPSIATAVAQGDRDRVGRTTRGAGRFLLVLLIPIAAIGMANAGEIMAFVYGEPYRAGAPILVMLLVSHGVLFTVFVSFSSVLIGLSIEREPAWIALGAIPLAAVLNIALIPWLGAFGAPLAAIASTSAAATAVTWRIRVHVGEILTVATVLRIVTLSVFIWAASLVVPSSGAGLLVELVVASLVYGGLAYLIGLIRRSDLELIRAGREQA